MRRSVLGIFALASLGLSSEVGLNQDPQNQQQCQGMYSRASWGGSIDPFILVTFRGYQEEGKDDPNEDPILSAVIFEYSDHVFLGVEKGGDSDEVQYVCDQEAIEDRHCTPEELGRFIVAANSTTSRKADIRTEAIHLRAQDRPAINYPIKKTGYYCISTVSFGTFPYEAVAEFRNAYGELPGSQIAKLPFYGGLAIVYAVIGAFWAFLYVQHRRDILAVQNYITVTIGFLVGEMVATWGYYDHMNRNGSDTGSKILVIVVAVLNALRNSLSFFLLLIVCMGYGVVVTTLGKRMLYARILGATHFVFGVIYAIASLSITPEDAGPLVLLVVLPLAATLTAFYVWTLNSLSFTMKDLMARKQRVKALMYRKLWWCILGSVLIIFAFFFLNSFTFAGQSDPDFTPNHWQTRWFVLDGWLNLVYLADVAFIAYIWRPTANNRRFAMSEELAQDDEGFEIASVRDSMDMDLEDEPHKNISTPLPHYGNGNGINGHSGSKNRDASPLPAPTPQRPVSSARVEGQRRNSLQGETIFAVGDEDDHDGRLSSDDERGEGTRLKGKGD